MMENVAWENFIYEPWTKMTEPYIEQLFVGQAPLFYAFLMMSTVVVSYVKTESIVTPVAVLSVMGALLSGMLVTSSMYYFAAATAAGLGIILYMLFR